MKKVDVAIVGGGLAGGLLARQLRRAVPNASVAVFEKSTERRYKVGESTVEIATHYLIKRLGLSTYIYKEHLPKNGLRYFFDTPERDTPLLEMSELGVNALPPSPSFQLDRARLEPDLLEMNRKDGVEIHVGARVKDLALSADGHTFTVVSEEGEESWGARWVIDATGREGMLHKLRGLKVAEKSHRIAASWARARGVKDMDDAHALGGGPVVEEWLERANHTSRVLSTNHFMYAGYWIWLIPLRDGLTSIGAVQRSDHWNVSRHKEDGFLSFLREHAALAELLEDVELIDIGAFTQLAFRTKQFFDGGERWACVGDSGAFVDPFYSPGSDFIALENDLVTDLIARDFAGEDVKDRGRLFDDYMQFRFDTTMVIYDGLYDSFGSYELFRAKVFFDTALYYNLVFDPYVLDKHLDPRWIRTMLRRREFIMEMLGGFNSLFRGAAKVLQTRGDYHRANTGHYQLEGLKTYGVLLDVGADRTRREVNQRNEEIFAETKRLVSLCFDGDMALVEKLMSAGTAPDAAWEQLTA
ncbi:MAG: tryptophan 7-halogenase [Myxococcota bacterium]